MRTIRMIRALEEILADLGGTISVRFTSVCFSVVQRLVY